MACSDGLPALMRPGAGFVTCEVGARPAHSVMHVRRRASAALSARTPDKAAERREDERRVTGFMKSPTFSFERMSRQAPAGLALFIPFSEYEDAGASTGSSEEGGVSGGRTCRGG